MPLEFLADRDLGKRVVAVLREAGAVVHTLPEVFGGEGQAQRTEDADWIEVAGRNHWAALTKNRRIRYVTLERKALATHGVPLFALSNGNLNFTEMASALVVALPRIVEICEDWPGGSVWIVHRDGQVDKQWP